MQQQGSTELHPQTRPPWAPWFVALLAFLAPPGGAMLTADNLSRMGAVAGESRARIVTAIGVIYAVGLTALLVLAQPHLNRPPVSDGGTSVAISLGTAVASYVAQRRTFAVWRLEHSRTRTGSALRALLLTVGYTIIVFVGAVILRIAVAAAMGDAG